MSSFSLLEAGHGKARYVALRGRFRAGVLTSDWRCGALLCLSTSASQLAVYGILSSALRKLMPSFSLLEAGHGKARYVALRVAYAFSTAHKRAL